MSEVAREIMERLAKEAYEAHTQLGRGRAVQGVGAVLVACDVHRRGCQVRTRWLLDGALVDAAIAEQALAASIKELYGSEKSPTNGR